jgi:hypothetical protein
MRIDLKELKMQTIISKRILWGVTLLLLALLSVVLLAINQSAAAEAPPGEGIICTNGPNFTLTTMTGYIGTPDDNVVYMWGYSEGTSDFQHPSPVLCVNQGETVTVILHNTLPEDVSITFPGQDDVLADGAPAQPQFTAGELTSLTNVAPKEGGSVTYSFVANHPGSFIYQSGTNPDKQVRMGLFGVLIVRPDISLSGTHTDAIASPTVLTDAIADFTGKEYLIGRTLINETDGSSCTITAIDTTTTLTCAVALDGGTNNEWQQDDTYQFAFANNRLDSQFKPDTEFLVLLSEIDPYLNQAVEREVVYGQDYTFNMANYHPRYWLINGRGFPDSFAPNGASWLPTQPYGAMARVEEYIDGDPLSLTRYLSVGTVDIPMHPHSKSALVIGRDGRAYEGPGGEDLSFESFSLPMGPGQSWDGLFRWYDPDGYDPVLNPVTVDIPSAVDAGYGPLYSASPYLGQQGTFPVDFTTLNQCGEYYVISHVHALHKITSWGAPMTGPITFLRIDPPGGCPQ